MCSKNVKVLIIDDEKDICNFVKLLFRKKGFLVYSALSGRRGIQIAKKVKPDIVLIDIHLRRGIDGLEALREIRKLVLGSYCIMVTWDSAHEKIKAAKKLGATSYLTKPLTATELYRTVNRFATRIRKRG